MLTLAEAAHNQAAYIQYNSQKGQFSIQNLQPPTTAPKSSKPAAWGSYFWEFGDGHYSFDSIPEHRFSRPGLYEVRVCLTPHYSYSKPLIFTKKISVRSTGATGPSYSLANKWVSMESSGSQYLVPGHEMQFAIHYQAPPGKDTREGYVLLFYNNKKENKDFTIKFDPFVFKEERFYYGEQALGDDFFSLPQEGLPAEGLAAAKALFNQHKNLRIFKTGKLQAGQEQRLFCTIATEQRLEDHQDKNRELSIAAIWLPAYSAFDSRKNQFVHKMEILEVHDPNRIKVHKGSAYYLPRRHTRLNYKVDFQNKAMGVVEDVVIRIPIPKELDTRTLEIHENLLDPVVTLCADTIARDEAPCYELDTKMLPEGDSMIFAFQNIALEGTKSRGFFQNKKSTKGSLSFSIQNNKKRVAQTQISAYIFFKGSQETIKTQITTTKWRQRSINLSLGQNFHQRETHHTNTASNFSQKYNICITALDAPLGKGLLFGLQAGATAFHFTRTEVTEAKPSLLLPGGGIWYRSETINPHYLEGRALAGYQLNRFIRFHAGAGLSAPLKAELSLEAYAAPAIDADPVIYSYSSTDGGILAGTPPARVFEQEIDARRTLGLNALLGVQLGLPNDLSLGLNYEVRRVHHFNNRGCSLIRSWQVYLRGKLFAFR